MLEQCCRFEYGKTDVGIVYRQPIGIYYHKDFQEISNNMFQLLARQMFLDLHPLTWGTWTLAACIQVALYTSLRSSPTNQKGRRRVCCLRDLVECLLYSAYFSFTRLHPLATFAPLPTPACPI